MNKITMYHNPRCSKSRATLALLEERGIEPEVILYLEATPDTETLAGIIRKLDITPRDLLRKGESAYRDLNLASEDITDAELIEAMVREPILIERPIVVCGEKAVIGRPPEKVLDLI